MMRHKMDIANLSSGENLPTLKVSIWNRIMCLSLKANHLGKIRNHVYSNSSIYLSIYLSHCQFISIYLSISVYLNIYIKESIYLSIYLSIFLYSNRYMHRNRATKRHKNETKKKNLLGNVVYFLTEGFP